MGKSKTGGTRGYIRGRIANDVYSIGKDGKGKKQQVIRSLAESVANPRTSSQMFGRMIMSTVMQAVSGLSAIIDHAFDGIPTGQPNISEFIRLNYALVSADAKAHPASGNSFGLVKFGEKGIRQGAYQISDGQVVADTTVLSFDANVTKFNISPYGATLDVAAVKEAMGLASDDYCTLVAITVLGTVEFVRLRINPALSDDTVITDDNVDTLFVTEGNTSAIFRVNNGTITVQTTTMAGCAGFILSKKVNGAYQHSKSVMQVTAGASYNSDAALPTYPTGNEQFLNGGDI